MRRILHALAMLLGLTLLAADPASAARPQGQKVASGSAALAQILASENLLLSTERAGEEVALSYDIASGSPVAARGAGETTRVGRWMSRSEFETMSSTGRVVEGTGGRTSVIRPPNPASFKPPPSSPVYAEFDVPTGVLRQGGRADWAIIPGPNVNTRNFDPPPSQMPPATCIVCVIGN